MTAPSPQASRHVFVSGTVQGVAFRYYTQREAQRLGVMGWVRNRRDGRVEVFAVGAKQGVDELVSWLRRGPPAAVVHKLEDIEESPEGGCQGSESFELRPTL